MRGRLLKLLMVVLVLIPVGLTAYLANSLYHRKGVPEALQSLTHQLFQSKAEENKAEKRAAELEKKASELQKAYDSLVADLHGEVDAREIRVRRYREKLEINFVDKVLFASGSAEVTPRGREILTKVAGVLGKLGEKSIYVVGHTDNKPIHSALFPSNWELSTSRAAAVIRFLSENGQVPPERFSAMGRAFYQPVASNATPEGRQENRRVDIVVTEAPIFGDTAKAPEAQTGADQPPRPDTGDTQAPRGIRERSLQDSAPEKGEPSAPEAAQPAVSPAASERTQPSVETDKAPAGEPSAAPVQSTAPAPAGPDTTPAPAKAQSATTPAQAPATGPVETPATAPAETDKAQGTAQGAQAAPEQPSPAPDLPPVLPDKPKTPGDGS